MATYSWKDMTTGQRHPAGRKGIPLRAHHLLCILGFQGIGYTAEFIRNLQKVKRMIEQNPDLIIEIVDDCDVVCIQCPNSQGPDCFKGRMSDNKVVRDMDRRVMDRLGIKAGDRFKAKDIYNMIKARIRPEDLKELCSGCEWLSLGFCPRGLESLKY
ncbi:MAG TPA: DUF1284 domain-containing protein [Methanocella sp.]|nr:DUF1284 domain-containing protein [Methanocella sp.]